MQEHIFASDVESAFTNIVAHRVPLTPEVPSRITTHNYSPSLVDGPIAGDVARATIRERGYNSKYRNQLFRYVYVGFIINIVYALANPGTVLSL